MKSEHIDMALLALFLILTFLVLMGCKEKGIQDMGAMGILCKPVPVLRPGR